MKPKLRKSEGGFTLTLDVDAKGNLLVQANTPLLEFRTAEEWFKETVRCGRMSPTSWSNVLAVAGSSVRGWLTGRTISEAYVWRIKHLIEQGRIMNMLGPDSPTLPEAGSIEPQLPFGRQVIKASAKKSKGKAATTKKGKKP